MDIKEKMQAEQNIYLAKNMLNMSEEELKMFCESILDAFEKLGK